MKRMLDTKIALVTGGNSGIGRASAILFTQKGAKVAITGRNAAEGEAVVAEITAGGGEAIFIQSDLTVAGPPQPRSRRSSRLGDASTVRSITRESAAADCY